MDIENTIDIIRDNISKLNKELTQQSHIVEKKQKISNSKYYENQQLAMLKRADKKKIEKMRKGEEINDDENCIRNEELELKIKEDTEMMFKKPWSKLTLLNKKISLEKYINNIQTLDIKQKTELNDKLHLLLGLGKLTAKIIEYNPNEGKIENIKKLSIDDHLNKFTLSI